VFVVTTLLLSVFWSHATPHLCHPSYWLAGDSGLSVYNAWATGSHVIYRDVLDYRTPIFFFAYALFMKVTGPSPAWAQALTIVSAALTAPIAFATAVRVGARRVPAAALSVAAVVVMFAVWPFTYPPWFGWPMLAASTYSLARAFAGGAEADRGWLARAGMFGALYYLTIQSFGGPFLLGATVALIALGRGRRLRTAGWFVGGGVLAGLPVLAFLVVTRTVRQAYFATITWPSTSYYNGFIKGHYPLAGVFEYWKKYGKCKIGHVGSVYTASVGAIPIMAALGVVVCLGFTAVIAARVVKKQELTGAQIALGVLACAGFVGTVPEMIWWSLSDNVHVAQASLAGLVPFAAIASSSKRPIRWALDGVAVTLFAIALFVSADRLLRYHPFAKKYRDFDAYVTRYAGAQTLAALSEPGDAIIHLPYGGWELLTARRANGVSPAFVFNDVKMFPEPMWQRFVREIRANAPTLMQFTEKPLEQRFFTLDPTLRARYFWNGAMWERKDPPLAAATLAPSYTVGTDQIDISQTGQELHATHKTVALVGSVRDDRVFLTGAGETLLGHIAADGTIHGTWRGKPAVLKPLSPP
jgi:hypothetical protein